MARSGSGGSGTKPQQTSPPAGRRSRSAAAHPELLSVRGGERAGVDEVAMVRRSSIAPCVCCGLCGGPLRDATTASECLHSFCRKCISEKFKDDDKKCCPTCNIDLGCDPKLRADRSLQCISSVIFPAKRRKMEECSSLHPELVLLPSLTPGADGAYLSVYKMDAYLVDEPMNIDTLSSEVDITAEGRSALPQVASQRESQKNTAKMLESIEVYTGGTQALEAEKVRPREEFENERAQRDAACKRTKFVEERFQREFEMSQSTASILQMIDGYIGHSQAFEAENAKQREESENERADKAVFLRTRILEGRMHTGPESIQSESEIGQKVEAALRELFFEYRNLDLQISAKSKELATLLNSHMLGKESIVWKRCSKNLMCEDINCCCPVCAASDKKLRDDHSLQHVRSIIFPDASLVGGPMDDETATKADESLRMEPSASPTSPRQSQVTTDSPDQIRMEHDENVRSQVFSICNENSERIMQHFEARITQSQVYKEYARLKEELENVRTEKAVAFERAKVLEERLEEQTERLQSESMRSQEIEAAQREVLREYRVLKYEMAKKSEELSNWMQNFTMIEKRSIEVEQRNSVLEGQIDHVNRLLEAERSNTRKLNEELGKAVDEKNKLTAELEAYDDGLSRIQTCIRKSLTARMSRLKDIVATVKLGHYQHLLARIDALGQVQDHLPKLLETIEVATSLSAYSLAAAMLIRLRAYHGDAVDLQRLILPLHLNRQEYARVRNVIDPLAAKIAQKYRVCKD
ncbi:hypothetical protein U9M48_011935 [Paspalum notatum var. saurae]|uniref:RING-type domain-containing protein n=1 Tax=Paspalum notatum var. saurae TaxID=547442 RepID=A0AAQ3WI32_PASNO